MIVTVKQQRPVCPSRNPGGRGQQPWTVHVKKIGPVLFGQVRNLARQSGLVKRKPEKVTGGLLSGLQRAQSQRVSLDPQAAQLGNEPAIARRRAERVPPARSNGGHQIQQALLRTAEIAELVEKENVHCAGVLFDSRTAHPSTRK